MIARFLPLLLLAGCASTAPTASAGHDSKAAAQASAAVAGIPVAQPAPDQQQVIVGSGSADERKVIDDSNQRILDAEHAGSTDGTASPSGVNQGIP